MPTLKPTTGVIGLPDGVKQAGRRVDFRPDDFTLAIETKGYRIAWSRAAPCPCASINQQTQQPDPLCPLCEGSSWLYFKPTDAVNTAVGELTGLQTEILSRNKASAIRGIMSQFNSQKQPYQVVGNWQEGDNQLTTRPENKLAYYDRIVNLDSLIVYAEVVEVGDSDDMVLRYLAESVNLIRSVDTEYVPSVDYEVIRGDVVWYSKPASGTRVLVHYLCHPTWLVIEHPHIIRTTLRSYKTAASTTPYGNPEALPVQAKVRYEFIL